MIPRWPVLMLLITMLPAPAAEILHRGLGPEPDSLDIHLARTVSAFNLLRDLHEGLLTRDAAGRPAPGVARSWTIAPDGLVWRFALDPDARWSDGSPVTAADFVRGFRRALDPETASPVAGWLDPIARTDGLPAVTAVDRQTLEIVLKRPVPWFEELLTLPVTYPRHPDGGGHFSGPFRLQDHVPGSRLELVANPHYREAGALRLDGVTWHVIEDASVELSRYRAGNLHVTETLPPGRAEWLRRQFGEQLRIAPYLGSYFLVYNLSREPFADRPELREALSLAIDRERITRQVLGTGERPAWRLVPPDMPGWRNGPGPGQNLDDAGRLERARTLYARAGYSSRQPLEVELRFNTSLTHRRLAVAIAAMWKETLGVRTRMVHEEWKVFVTNRRQGRITQVMRGDWIADWADPAGFLQLFVSDSPLNYSFFDDTEFDRAMRRAQQTGGAERMEHLWRAEEQLLSRHVLVPLYYYVSRHLVKPEVQGFVDNPMDIHLSRYLYLSE